MKLAGMSRQNITDAQKGLQKKNGKRLQREMSTYWIAVQPSPAFGHGGQCGRDSNETTHRTNAAVVSGPQISPKTQFSVFKKTEVFYHVCAVQQLIQNKVIQ